ncbi:MAG: hypothetical protein NUV57_05020 [archaeon]|nr:hypothetical protein [archaeon]
MDETQETILLGVIFGFTIAGVAFASFFSGLDKLNLISPFLLEGILATIFSAGFIAFTLILPLPYAFISALSLHREKKETYGIAGIGILLAIISWILLFGINATDILLGVFFIISIRIVVEITLIKHDELKRFVTFRTVAGAAKTAFFIFAIGIFISSAMMELENQEQNIQEFGNTIMTLALEESGNQNTNELLTNLIINTRRQVVTSIMQTPQFETLQNKTDEDVVSFVLLMNALESNVNSDSAKQDILNQLNSNQENNQQVLNFEAIRAQSPLIDSMAENLWLVISSSVVLMFIFFANIILSNLAGVYAVAIDKGFDLKSRKTNSELKQKSAPKPNTKPNTKSNTKPKFKRSGIEVIREKF